MDTPNVDDPTAKPKPGQWRMVRVPQSTIVKLHTLIRFIEDRAANGKFDLGDGESDCYHVRGGLSRWQGVCPYWKAIELAIDRLTAHQSWRKRKGNKTV